MTVVSPLGVGGNGVCLSSVQLFLFWSHFGCTGKPLGLLGGGGSGHPGAGDAPHKKKSFTKTKRRFLFSPGKSQVALMKGGAQHQGVRVKGKAHCIYCCCVRRIKLSQKTHSSVFGSETRTTCFPTWGGIHFQPITFETQSPTFCPTWGQAKIAKINKFWSYFQ